MVIVAVSGSLDIMRMFLLECGGVEVNAGTLSTAEEQRSGILTLLQLIKDNSTKLEGGQERMKPYIKNVLEKERDLVNAFFSFVTE